ncbi:MAG: recombinase RecA [Pseudomonadota bacterium]
MATVERMKAQIGERARALAAVLLGIRKQFGEGSLMVLGEAARPVEVISTGSLAVDRALGCGGLPRGRVVEIYGAESSGKTTLALLSIARCQAEGGVAAFVDAEHALDPGYARRIGVDLDGLLISQPDCGEQALEITDALVRSNAVDLVVIDSVAALVPRAEIEGEMGDAHVGLQARLMSQALRKLAGAVARTRTTVVFVNQIRQKIGPAFGNPETTTGGNALKFYASVRLELRRIGQVKEGERIVGTRSRVRVVKNKVAPPFREAEIEIRYDEGLNRDGELVELALQEGIFERSGGWYLFEGERLGQGKERTTQALEARPELREAVERRLRETAARI